MRTFIAIDLTQNLKKTLSQLTDQFRNQSAAIKWVKESGMHLTLKFLGDIPEVRTSEVKSILAKICNLYQRFILKLIGTGTFPPGEKNPRVIWIGIEDAEPLIALQSQIETELHKKGFPKETRAFHPHLTLGRIKGGGNFGNVLSELDRLKDSSFGQMNVEEISFFRSTLKPSGAEHTVLSTFGLR